MPQLFHRLSLSFTLVAAAWLSSHAAAASASGEQSATHPTPHRLTPCPPPDQTADTLAQSGQLMDQSRYTDAIAVLTPLTPHHCDPRIPLILSGAYEGSGDLPKAESTLEDAHTTWPSNTAIATSLAREYLASGQTDKALQSLASFHVTPITPPQELEEAALVYLAGHHLDLAQTTADAANRRYPSLRSLLLLANVLQLQGRYKDVNAMLETKRPTYTNSSAFLITFAESEYDAMLYDQAHQDLTQAVTLTPNSYQAHFLLGNVLLAQNNPDQAAAEYRTAITLAPNQPRTYYQLALISRKSQDDATEQQLLTQALTADDHYAPAYAELGRILVDQHQYAAAVDKLRLAIQWNPQAEQAYYFLSRAYASLGDHDKSVEMAKLYTKIREANRRSFVNTHPGQVGATSSNPE